ncbi:MAG: hypothetical protein ACFFD4_23105 [Candidatus Odinarchaeota archaeon]
MRDRKFRNHFEHFDERIDKWAEKGGGSLIDRVIGDLNKIKGIEPEKTFRHYDPVAKAITFYKEPYSTKVIKDAIQALRDNIKVHPVFLAKRAKTSTGS